VLRDPDLLILDEATNALDAALEDEIRGNLRRLFAGRTLLLITHRMETAMAADHVVLVRGGTIAGTGAPGALFAGAGGPAPPA
jgi:subfamily B ATP-binding cassette protein MsbA